MGARHIGNRQFIGNVVVTCFLGFLLRQTDTGQDWTDKDAGWDRLALAQAISASPSQLAKDDTEVV